MRLGAEYDETWQVGNFMLSAPPLEQRVSLSGITWTTYQRIKAELDNRNLRLTYHQGVLEIMAPSPEHEYFNPDISQMSRIELGRGGEGSIVSQLYEQVVAECSSKPAKWENAS